MKKLYSIICLFIISSLFSGFFGCASPKTVAPAEDPDTSVQLPSDGGNTGEDDQPEDPDDSGGKEDESRINRVRFYDIPAGVQRYESASVTVGGEELPLYNVMVNTEQVWSPNNYKRTDSGVGLFELDGTATVAVAPDVQINYSSVVRPLSAKITPIADLQNNTLTFSVKSAGEYVLEINGDPDNAIHFFVSEYGEEEDLSGYDNVIYFSSGLHTAQNDEYINSDNTVTLGNNTLVYLQDGAVVRAKFVANNATRIAVKGRGIIDGSTFDRDAEKGTVTVPIDFNYCSDVTLEDFTVLDPAGWCVNFYFNENSKIENIKIITSRSNGDGISLQSCKNITVDGCFVRTWDDTLVVKNYPRWDNRSIYGATENITFTNCTLWTDLAQSMEIGYETVGEKLENVTFENITVLHARHYAVISIHNSNNAAIKNITFENITIEDAATPCETVGIFDIRNLYSETWSTVQATTPLGSISNVKISNVKIISARMLSMTMGGCRDTRAGYESDHYLNDLSITNVSVAGVQPQIDQVKINSTGYYAAFYFTQNGEVTGAQFIFGQSGEYLSGFGTECKVERVGV